MTMQTEIFFIKITFLHSGVIKIDICCYSQKLLRSPRKPTRKISKIPFKVLDAPELQDDFYLNLVDWSSLNVLSVGLGTCVYLWSACTSQVLQCVSLKNYFCNNDVYVYL